MMDLALKTTFADASYLTAAELNAITAALNEYETIVLMGAL